MRDASASHAIEDGGNEPSVVANNYTRELGALLSALSTVLDDTLERFATISGRVTERVLMRGDAADHDLIVALQDFDRLQQEFAALRGVIAHCAVESSRVGSGAVDALPSRAVIADITLSDLKSRFLNSLHDSTFEMMSAGGDEKVF